jgi:branched-chain amino acid transport system permease protein
MSIHNNRAVVPVLAGIVALALPLVVNQSYPIRICVMIAYFAIAAYGWDIIGGYAGQISIGQSTFFAIGAYSVAIGFLSWNISPVGGLVIGVVLAGLIALGVGVVVLRLRGPYFTLCTLAVCEVMRILLLHFKDLTGGPEGRVIPFTSGNLYALQFDSELPYYYIAVGLLAVAMYSCHRVNHSRLGYQLAAIRNNEEAAESVGITLMAAKVKAFVISAVVTSLAGSFYVIYDHYIDPSSTASVDLSIKILLIALLGGRRSLWGPLVGSLVLIPLTEVTNAYLGSVRPGASLLLYSIVILAVIMYAPDGIVRIFKSSSK